LAERIDELGGISDVLLGHRDDVADAGKWAKRYGAWVWIHEHEADAAPYATHFFRSAKTVVAEGVVALHAPGHTRGHMAFHIDNRWLFTGDTVHFNPRRLLLDVTPRQTWHSWDVLAKSIMMLSRLPVEGVFPTHGMWRLMSPATYAAQMKDLATSMAQLGQTKWAERDGAMYSWY